VWRFYRRSLALDWAENRPVPPQAGASIADGVAMGQPIRRGSLLSAAAAFRCAKVILRPARAINCDVRTLLAAQDHHRGSEHRVDVSCRASRVTETADS
jgi:hypothetical protein